MPAVPSLPGDRVVRALEKAGFAVAREGRDVAKGTLRGILADTHL